MRSDVKKGKNVDFKEPVFIIKRHGEIEKELLICKQCLAKCPDFSLNDIYEKFDSRGVGVIDSNIFEKTLRKLGVYCVADEAKMIIKRFGRGKTEMKYSEFTRLFTGAKQPYFSIMNTTSAKRFSLDTSDLIQQLFELHIQSEAILEKFRQRVF